MREKGEVGIKKARSKVGFDTGVPGEWYGSAKGGAGIRNWGIGIRVLPLQGQVSCSRRLFYQSSAPSGAGRSKNAVGEARSK